MKPKLLVVLQCPWKKGKLANGWDREIWFEELWRSRTGVRLSEAIPEEEFEVEICNSNPTLVDTPDGVLPPDLKHLRTLIEIERPNVILACGNVARGAIKELKPSIPVVEMPHPAFRLLSKRMTGEVRQRLTSFASSFIRS